MRLSDLQTGDKAVVVKVPDQSGGFGEIGG